MRALCKTKENHEKRERQRDRALADLKKACVLFQVRSSIFPGRPGVRMWRRLRQMDAVGKMGGLRGVNLEFLKPKSQI